MSLPLIVDIRAQDIAIRRPALTNLDRETAIYIELDEIEELVKQLKGAKAKMAKDKRVTAQRLLAEAEYLDPTGMTG